MKRSQEFNRVLLIEDKISLLFLSSIMDERMN